MRHNLRAKHPMPNKSGMVSSCRQIGTAPVAGFPPSHIVAPTIDPELWADIAKELPFQFAPSTAACEVRVPTAHGAAALTFFEVLLITSKMEAVAARERHVGFTPTTQ